MKKDKTGGAPVSVPQLYPYSRFSDDVQEDGDSERRQNYWLSILAKDEGLPIFDGDPLHDSGYSGYHEENLRDGALGRFMAWIDEDRIARGSVLAIERLDRLSRAKPLRQLSLFIRIMVAGVIIRTAKPDKRYTEETCDDTGTLLGAILEMCGSYQESHKKHDWVGEAWSSKRQAMREDAAFFSGELPGWLERSPEGIRFKPGAEATMREILRMAQEGRGSRRIVRLLNQAHDQYPCFGHGDSWSMSYITKILTGREILGEFQPKRTVRNGRNQPDGPPIPGKFPCLLTEDEWQSIQHGKRRRKGVGGRPGEAETNLFTRLVWFAKTGCRGSLRPGTRKGKVYWYMVESQIEVQNKRWSDGLSFPYPLFERCMVDYLGELTEAEIMPRDQDSLARSQRIKELMEQIRDAKETMSYLEAEVSKPGIKVGKARSLNGQIDSLRETLETLVEECNALKMVAQSARVETLDEVQSVIEELKQTKPEDLPSVRGKLKGLIAEIVESIWVIVQRVNRLRRHIHLQVYFRWGQHRNLVIAAEGHCETPPLELGDLDFRTYRQSEGGSRENPCRTL